MFSNKQIGSGSIIEEGAENMSEPEEGVPVVFWGDQAVTTAVPMNSRQLQSLTQELHKIEPLDSLEQMGEELRRLQSINDCWGSGSQLL